MYTLVYLIMSFISGKIFIYALSIKPWTDLAGGFLTHI